MTQPNLDNPIKKNAQDGCDDCRHKRAQQLTLLAMEHTVQARVHAISEEDQPLAPQIEALYTPALDHARHSRWLAASDIMRQAQNLMDQAMTSRYLPGSTGNAIQMPPTAQRAWEAVSNVSFALLCLGMAQDCMNGVFTPPANAPDYTAQTHAWNSVHMAIAAASVLLHNHDHLALAQGMTAEECQHPGREENRRKLLELQQERDLLQQDC